MDTQPLIDVLLPLVTPTVIWKIFESIREDARESRRSAALNAIHAIGVRSVDEELRELCTTDNSNLLMRRYYDAVPHRLVALALRPESTLEQYLTSVKEKVATLLKDPSAADPEVSSERRNAHRARCYGLLAPLQCIAMAVPLGGKSQAETIRDLAKAEVAHILAEAIHGDLDLVERDGAYQIASQMMTERLIAGPVGWTSFRVSGETLNVFIELGQNEDLRLAHQTGLVLSLQFLAYYKASLEQSQPEDPALKRVAAYLDEVRSWGLSDITAAARNFLDLSRSDASGPKDWSRLPRQSSAAIIDRQSCPLSSQTLATLLGNNVRAIAAVLDDSVNLPARLDKVAAFLLRNGVEPGFLRKNVKDLWDGSDDRIRRHRDAAEKSACALQTLSSRAAASGGAGQTSPGASCDPKPERLVELLAARAANTAELALEAVVTETAGSLAARGPAPSSTSRLPMTAGLVRYIRRTLNHLCTVAGLAQQTDDWKKRRIEAEIHAILAAATPGDTGIKV